jgi:hypothetical protein
MIQRKTPEHLPSLLTYQSVLENYGLWLCLAQCGSLHQNPKPKQFHQFSPQPCAIGRIQLLTTLRLQSALA